jgi:hypothetical protein
MAAPASGKLAESCAKSGRNDFRRTYEDTFSRRINQLRYCDPMGSDATVRGMKPMSPPSQSESVT